MYMHVCMIVLFAVDISEMTITPSDPSIGTAGDMFTLSCSVNITPNPLPEDVPLHIHTHTQGRTGYIYYRVGSPPTELHSPNSLWHWISILEAVHPPRSGS